MTAITINSVSLPIPNVTDISKLWCVYELHQPPQIIYVNACRLVDVFHLKQARENSEWFRMFHAGGPMTLTITHLTVDRNEAQKLAIQRTHSVKPMPRCNLHGYNMNKSARPLICSNGQTYRNQSEAAQALNLGQSNISRHLRGELTHVGGYTFAYATAPDGAPQP